MHNLSKFIMSIAHKLTENFEKKKLMDKKNRYVRNSKNISLRMQQATNMQHLLKRIINMIYCFHKKAYVVQLNYLHEIEESTLIRNPRHKIKLTIGTMTT